jgi:glycosyltransferase
VKVSIITAVRNGISTVADALESVQEQDYSDIEHVVMDGASTDGTAELLQARRGQNGIVVSEPDNGIYDALNKGMRLSTGVVIGVLHADDIFHSPMVIASVVSAMQRGSVDLVYGDLHYVRRLDPTRTVRFWRSGEFRREALRFGWMPPHPTVFIRRQVLETVGEYDTSFRIAADYDFLLRVLKRRDVRCAYLPEVLVRMRVGGASNGTLRGILQKSKEDLRAIRRNGVGGVPTLIAKNLRKVPQFVLRT